jgi:hypothetical protein
VKVRILPRSPLVLVAQRTGHRIPNPADAGSNPAEDTDAMSQDIEDTVARFSPVREAVRKTAVSRFDPGPRLHGL